MKEKRDKPGRPPNHPRILIVELGVVVDSYEEAAKLIGGNRGAICNILTGTGNRSTHMGYHFKFVD